MFGIVVCLSVANKPNQVGATTDQPGEISVNNSFVSSNMHANSEDSENHAMGDLISNKRCPRQLMKVDPLQEHVLRMPVGLTEGLQTRWLSIAKNLANDDFKATGRSQEIIRSAANVASALVFPIGNSTVPRVDAVDVASYQNWMTQADYNQLKKLGVKAVIIKASEGSTYANPYASAQVKYAKNAGLQISVYHFARFTNTQTAQSEAAFTAKTINSLGLPKNTLIFADMEADETNLTSVGNNLTSFWQKISTSGYTNHAVYTGLLFGDNYSTRVTNTVGKDDTWWAQYPYTPTSTNLLHREYGAWQFSSTATLPGRSQYIDTSIDYNGLLINKQVDVSEPAQSPWVADDRYVTVTSANYPIYRNFSWESKQPIQSVSGKTYHSTGKYYHSNGSTYLSLYDNKGVWQGYINKKAVSVASGQQGVWQPKSDYVKITHHYDIWRNFQWKASSVSSQYYNQIVKVDGQYKHFNGSIYYSVYSVDGEWLGYINSDAVVDQSSQGPIHSESYYVTIKSKNYDLWNNFSFQTKYPAGTFYQHTFLSKGYYLHINGSKYLSLYDLNGKWYGYINANATSIAPGAQGAWLKENRYVTLTKKGYPLWQSFFGGYSNSTTSDYQKTYHVTGMYNHANGEIYYSLYDSKGNWHGYVNSKATTVGNGTQGAWIALNQKVKVNVKGYTIWRRFFGGSKTNTTQLFGQTLNVNGQYHCVDGNIYYSLYDTEGGWIGYVNSKAVGITSKW